MRNIYSRLIPTPTYGEFYLPFTCDCGEEHMVTIKVNNGEGFEYLQHHCNHCKKVLRVYVIRGFRVFRLRKYVCEEMKGEEE